MSTTYNACICTISDWITSPSPEPEPAPAPGPACPALHSSWAWPGAGLLQLVLLAVLLIVQRLTKLAPASCASLGLQACIPASSLEFV